MNAETALTIMGVLDEAEHLLGQIRLRQEPIRPDTLSRNREILEEARRRLADVAEVQATA